MDTPMVYSKTGEKLTQMFESCKLQSYRDVKGVWTIGYGHTGVDVYAGLKWTLAQANTAFMTDIKMVVSEVNRLVKPQLDQNEFDALVDFVYNVGAGHFRSSSLLALLNAGQYAAAASQFEHWRYCGGVEVAGLLRRRVAEATLFKGGELT